MSKTLSSTLGALAALAVLCGALLASEDYGTLLKFDAGEVYYQAPVTEQDANKLGEFLLENDFFDSTPKTVQLLKKDGQLQVRFVVVPEAAHQIETQKVFRLLGGFISQLVFDSQAIEVHITDAKLTTLYALSIPANT